MIAARLSLVYEVDAVVASARKAGQATKFLPHAIVDAFFRIIGNLQMSPT
jgi:hypothetical protein